MKPRCILPILSALLLLSQNSVLATGTITTSNVNFGPGSNALFTLNGRVAGSQYDQIIATQSVTINDANLVLTVGFTPTVGTMFEIINNQGSGAVSGTGFSGLTEGAIFSVSGDFFQITYQGGTGNDVVLTAEAAPAVPDSGPTWMLFGTGIALLITFGSSISRLTAI
jgi:hypothetical protein